jgi:hypothetical protein
MKLSKIFSGVLIIATFCLSVSHAFATYAISGALPALGTFLTGMLYGTFGAHAANFASLGNFADSLYEPFQARVRNGLQAAEMRELDTMVLKYAMDNQGFWEDRIDINSIKKSIQRVVYAYQFNRINTASGSGMTTFPSGTLGTSVQLPITFVTFTQNFALYNVSGLDNVFAKPQMFDNTAKQAMRLLRTSIRQWMTTNLYNNRTTTLPYGLTGIKNANWNSATDAYEIPSGSQWAANIASVMQQASYGYSSYDAFLDPVLMPQYQYSAAQTAQNAINLSYQFDKNQQVNTPNMGGYFENLWPDMNLGTTVPIESGYTNGTALVMPKNSFCFIQWMPGSYYMPGFAKDFMGYTGGYGTIGDNMYPGLEYQIFAWNNQYDSSGSYGQAQGQQQNFQLGITLAFFVDYLSNTGETPIYQFALTGA